MRKALCIGIDYYESCGCLESCVDDARAVAAALMRHHDDKLNFDVRILCAEDESKPVTNRNLREAVEILFNTHADTVLFYYSGHGAVDAYGGYLCGSDVDSVDAGLSLDRLMKIVSTSKAKNKIIILDSCHSGYAGKIDRMSNYLILPDNTTILAASPSTDPSFEGVFTPLFIEAVNGGAMNLLGEVSPGDIYAYIERALGAWDQRPVFKANISSSICIKRNEPPIELKDLHKIIKLFDYPEQDFQLDPSYEEDKRDVEDKTRDAEHEEDFRILRKYAALNLVVPVDAAYMYQAAVYSKSCRLTPLGRYYWNLVDQNKI